MPTLYNVSAVTFATVGDINGDGVADIVTAGLGSLGIMLGTAAPVITPPPPPPPTPPSVALGGVLNAASFLKRWGRPGQGGRSRIAGIDFWEFPGSGAGRRGDRAFRKVTGRRDCDV